METEIITVTKISGTSVKYSGSKYFHGCHIDNFPHTPKVGEQFYLVRKSVSSAVLMEIKKEK